MIAEAILASGIFFCAGQDDALHWRLFKNNTYDFTQRCPDGSPASTHFYKALEEGKLFTVTYR